MNDFTLLVDLSGSFWIVFLLAYLLPIIFLIFGMIFYSEMRRLRKQNAQLLKLLSEKK